MTTKVLLDTDIGTDIDDAVCLAYLLAQPQCELLGITTVSGEAEKRAMLASVLCKAAGRRVPIYPGAEPPLRVHQRQGSAPQAAALERWSHDARFPSGEAVPFLWDPIRRNPGEVVLLAIGPLTNVAHLFQRYPEVASLLKGLVLMCGRFSTQFHKPDKVEWNALCDPHAAAIVYAAAPPVHRSIGLDVTVQVRINAQEARRRFTGHRLRPVFDFAEVWFEQCDTLTFHDPLAAATIFDDRICAFERGRVEIELGKKHAGLTRWRPAHSGGRHEVAATVDAARFFQHYFSVLGAATVPAAAAYDDVVHRPKS